MAGTEISRETAALREALRISFVLLKGIMLCVFIFFLFSGVFIVDQDEVGIVLRFGEVTGGKQQYYKPGIHFAWPYPIDEKIMLPGSKKVFGLEFNEFWMSSELEEYLDGRPEDIEVQGLDPDKAGFSLTGDMNVVHSTWSIRYKISDPVRFFRNVGDAADSETCRRMIRSAVASSIIREFGSRDMNDALGAKITEISRAVRLRTQDRLDRVRTGIQIAGVDLSRSKPPVSVEPAYNEVTEASSENQSRIEEANKYRNRLINEARGEARKIEEVASGRGRRIVKEAEADAQYLKGLVQRYRKRKSLLDLYVSHYYQEVLSRIFRNAESKYLVRKAPEGGGELRIRLSRQPSELTDKKNNKDKTGE